MYLQPVFEMSIPPRVLCTGPCILTVSSVKGRNWGGVSHLPLNGGDFDHGKLMEPVVTIMTTPVFPGVTGVIAPLYPW